ncbi:MAG TPA: hypothetical protein VEU33_02315 [Archangium sp.]|nr:hypothetical protein [Archangium sp.]
MPLSTEELLAIARKYWRADKAYDGSREHKRLTDLWAQKLETLGQWWALLDELKRELPGFTLGNATATPAACFRCAAYSPVDNPSSARRFIVVGCVSILAPVYTVYGVEYVVVDKKRHDRRVFFEPLPAEMRHPAEAISRRIEANFRVEALPRDMVEYAFTRLAC